MLEDSQQPHNLYFQTSLISLPNFSSETLSHLWGSSVEVPRVGLIYRCQDKAKFISPDKMILLGSLRVCG